MIKSRFIITLVCFSSIFFAGSTIRAADLHITEVLASNLTINYDPYYYNFSDWIEIYNASDSYINLKDYYLTDDPDDLLKYQVSYDYYIAPGQHKLFWADSQDKHGHVDFSIDADGEFIALVDPNGNILDSITLGQQYPDISCGRYQDTGPEWHYFDDPTPGSRNGTGLLIPAFSEDVIFSQGGGFYSGSVTVALSTDAPVEAIRYTLDGSFPDEYSDLYSGPIMISSNTTIRARTFTAGMLASPVKSNSYFINEDSLTLPVISISTAESYLSDDMIGIYVVGTNGIIDNCIDTAVNFNQDWERSVNLEYFLPDGAQVINQVVGIKITGGCSRNVPSKSFAIYAREKYGQSRMKYPFFPNKDIPEYKNLILRNAGNDYYYAYMRDGFMQTLVAGVTDIEYQSYQPVRVYINGRYWGILNMREKMNEHYLAANDGADPDSVDLIESNEIVIEGTDEHYTSMMNYLRSYDITQAAHYDHLCSLMDMNQFIDYYIAQIYFENEDWPFHNIKCWRPQTASGRWRWMLFDTDYGFGRWPRTGNTVHYALSDNYDATELASSLIDNECFRNEFTQRFAVYLSTIFTSERVLPIMDSLVNNLDTEMHLHIDRWGSPWSHDHWKENIEIMEDFALGRGALLYQQLEDELNLDGTVNLEIRSANSGQGRVKLHDVPLDSSLSTRLFKNIPVRVEAVPKIGFEFSHWSGTCTSGEASITLSLTQDDSLTAHFTGASPIENLFINELSSKTENGIPDETGETEDWIELYNGSSEAILLDNLFLTDSLDDPYKHCIDAAGPGLFIQPGEFLILFADNDPSQGKRHLNFKLSNQGETLALIQKIDSSYHIIDSVCFLPQYTGTSYGRSPVDSEYFAYLLPTPGSANTEKRIGLVVINEFMAANQSTIRDNKGEFEDWIELYNPGKDTLSLAGVFLTDSLPNTLRYHIPFTNNDSLILYPDSMMILWADNEPEEGIRHLGFCLSGQGESIGLVQPNGVDFIDSLCFSDVRQDVALGCLPDGSGGIQLLTSTPGVSNRVDKIENIFINEVVASNRNTGTDASGESDDWIELYNANDYPVNVGGLYLTDSLPLPIKCRIPSHTPDSTTIAPKGYLRLWADNTSDQGILHLNFKLSADGEELGLVRHDGIFFIDNFPFPELVRDAAFGRMPDGSRQVQLVSPSPLQANRVDTLKNLFINEFMSSNNWSARDEYGEYDDWIEIYNANPFPVDLAGIYLTDSLNNPLKHKLSGDFPTLTTIPSLGYLVLWADKEPEQGIMHLDFKLSNKGEQIGLFLEDGRTPIDTITYPDNPNEAPRGRFPDGSENIEYMLATPGTTNTRNLLDNIFISEFAASTQSLYQDEYGEAGDWIEIYNNNIYPVNLGGLFITDSLEAPDKFRIPDRCPDSTMIAPHERRILWADNQPEQGALHLDFALSGKGEELALVHPDGRQFLDSVSFPDQYPDISWGRKQDTLSWHPMHPTPGETNIISDVQGILFNEIMADNRNKVPDEHGNYSDWFELFNSNNFSIDIGGCFLTDSLAFPLKHRIPANFPEITTIPAGGYLILFADDSTELGTLHTNFKLSREGEELALFTFDGNKQVDALNYSEQYRNFALGRTLDNKTEWISMPPTPMAPNELPDLSDLVINEFMPDNDNWIPDENNEYDDWIELYNGSDVAIDIGGLFITDSLPDKTQHRISSQYPDSTTIPPGEYKLLWADNDEGQGIHHLGFKLSKEGDEIALFHYNGDIIDSISYLHTTGRSYGRESNGHSDWTWFDFPTPGTSNVITSLPDETRVNPYLLVYPNPMTEYIRFSLTNADPEFVSLCIYTLSGEKVFAQDFISDAGKYSIEWNATSPQGRPITPGFYFYHIIVGEQVFTGHFLKR